MARKNKKRINVGDVANEVIKYGSFAMPGLGALSTLAKAPVRMAGRAAEGANIGLQGLLGNNNNFTDFDPARMGLIGDMIYGSDRAQSARRQALEGYQPIFLSQDEYENSFIDDPIGSGAKDYLSTLSMALPVGGMSSRLGNAGMSVGRGLLGSLQNVEGDLSRPENLMTIGLGAAADLGGTTLTGGLKPQVSTIKSGLANSPAGEEYLRKVGFGSGNKAQYAGDTVSDSFAPTFERATDTGDVKLFTDTVRQLKSQGIPDDAIKGQASVGAQVLNINLDDVLRTTPSQSTQGGLAQTISNIGKNIEGENVGLRSFKGKNNTRPTSFIEAQKMQDDLLSNLKIRNLKADSKEAIAESIGNAQQMARSDLNTILGSSKQTGSGTQIFDKWSSAVEKIPGRRAISAQDQTVIDDYVSKLADAGDNASMSQLNTIKNELDDELGSGFYNAKDADRSTGTTQRVLKQMRDVIDETIKTKEPKARTLLSELSTYNKAAPDIMRNVDKGDKVGVNFVKGANIDAGGLMGPLRSKIGQGLQSLGQQGSANSSITTGAVNGLSQVLPQILSRATSSLPQMQFQGMSSTPMSSMDNPENIANEEVDSGLSGRISADMIAETPEERMMQYGITQPMQEESQGYNQEEINQFVDAALRSGKKMPEIKAYMELTGMTTQMNYTGLAGRSPQDIYIMALNEGKSPAEAANMAENLAGGLGGAKPIKYTENQKKFGAAAALAEQALASLEGGQVTTGKIATVNRGIGEFFGTQDPRQTDYYSKLDGARGVAISALSGANVPPTEYARIAGMIPDPNDEPAMARQKLKSFIENMQIYTTGGNLQGEVLSPSMNSGLANQSMMY
jgi:hypothetical protein